jgi:hypothetical protein
MKDEKLVADIENIKTELDYMLVNMIILGATMKTLIDDLPNKEDFDDRLALNVKLMEKQFFEARNEEG